MEQSQIITPSETGLLLEQKVEKPNVAGGTVSAAVGGNGIRPAAQVAYSLESKIDENESVTAGATATATIGKGISASAYAMYGDKSADGKIQTYLGLSVEYNEKAGASVSVGGRVDYKTDATVNAPVVGSVGVSVYGSVIASTNSKKTGAEVGVCGTGQVMAIEGSVCAGVRHDGQGNTMVTVGFGTKF